MVYINAINNGLGQILFNIVLNKAKKMFQILKCQIIDIQQLIGCEMKINVLFIIVKDGVQPPVLADSIIEYAGHDIVEDIALRCEMFHTGTAV